MNIEWNVMNVYASTEDGDKIIIALDTDDGRKFIDLDKSDAKWLVKKLKTAIKLMD